MVENTFSLTCQSKFLYPQSVKVSVSFFWSIVMDNNNHSKHSVSNEKWCITECMHHFLVIFLNQLCNLLMETFKAETSQNKSNRTACVPRRSQMSCKELTARERQCSAERWANVEEKVFYGCVCSVVSTGGSWAGWRIESVELRFSYCSHLRGSNGVT